MLKEKHVTCMYGNVMGRPVTLHNDQVDLNFSKRLTYPKEKVEGI